MQGENYPKLELIYIIHFCLHFGEDIILLINFYLFYYFVFSNFSTYVSMHRIYNWKNSFVNLNKYLQYTKLIYFYITSHYWFNLWLLKQTGKYMMILFKQLKMSVNLSIFLDSSLFFLSGFPHFNHLDTQISVKT